MVRRSALWNMVDIASRLGSHISKKTKTEE